MELRLKGYGTIEITKATLIDGGDILIEAADDFEKIAELSKYEITEVILTESEYCWGLVVWLKLPDDEWYDDDSILIGIENQGDIQRLNALL